MAAPRLPKSVKLPDVNPLVTCKICGGYFVDATTITECLHTFCRSCIVKHFKKSLFCPECDVQVERGCPLNKLRPDPRKQLLVYKMVPHLHENEVARQWNFLKQHKPLTGKPAPGQRPLLPGDLPEETIRDRIVDKIHLYSPEDKISLSMEYDSGVVNGGCLSEKQVNGHKRYLQCPAALTVYHLKKFIRLKYDIGSRFKITIFYEGEPLPDNSSLMDVAYQFFYEAKSPMRFTYRVSLGDVLKATENVNSRTNAVPAKSVPTVAVKPTTPAAATAPAAAPHPAAALPARPRGHPGHQGHQGSASSAASSSDESTASNRRQQRQRSAKTAAYTAIEAMDESDDERGPPKRRRLAAKSPRWESDRDSPEPFGPCPRVYVTRRTPKTSLEDFEARYNTRPAVKRVYATNSDDELSDPETKRNTLANKGVSKYGNFLSALRAESDGLGRGRPLGNGKKARGKKADDDVYEFHNEDNEDSNTTQEFDFVYDNSDPESADSEKRRGVNGDDRAGKANGHANGLASGAASIDEDLNDVDADEHELEQQIEMEVVTDTDDIEQHIEDSIEEVEVDADDDNQGNDDSQSAMDDQLEAETNSSTCLVIAEDEEEDDGVVEEVIAAEESGHELVVVEDPDENDASLTAGSEKQSDASRSPIPSNCSKSPSAEAEEDEPEIVHEKVFRKKSKKSKHHHHHHHHHHKRKRHHSPVLLISSPEEAPMKLTLKLRPTPSISPGVSSARSNPSKSPLPESPTKEKKVSIALSPRREANGGDSPSMRIYTCKITSPKESPPAGEAPEKASAAKAGDAAVPKAKAEPRPADRDRDRERPRAEVSPLRSRDAPSPAPSAAASAARDEAAVERRSVPDDVKERLTQMRQVRIKNTTITASTPISPPPSPAPSATKPPASVPDLKSVKTPSSLVISKVEAGEAPPRPEEPRGARKPALEILVLPPSPPPSDRQSDDSEECSTSSDVPEHKKAVSSPVAPKPAVKLNRPATASPRGAAADCVLDLSDRTRRDAPPAAHAPHPAPAAQHQLFNPAAMSTVSKLKPSPHPVQFLCGGQSDLVMGHPIINIQDVMSQATIATMNRMLASQQSSLSKLPILPLPQSLASAACAMGTMGQQRRLVPALHDMLRPSGFAVPASRPGPQPNHSVRHIPNPSALLHRQGGLHAGLAGLAGLQHAQQAQQAQQAKAKESKPAKPPGQQGQLTEQQLKERYQQFQQNRAAKAAFTYSRLGGAGSVNSAPARPMGALGALGALGAPGAPPCPAAGSMAGLAGANNNLLPIKAATIRPRSIEKVAGLLSVRAGAFVEAQAGL